jgi:hypothetical protein
MAAMSHGDETLADIARNYNGQPSDDFTALAARQVTPSDEHDLSEAQAYIGAG